MKLFIVFKNQPMPVSLDMPDDVAKSWIGAFRAYASGDRSQRHLECDSDNLITHVLDLESVAFIQASRSDLAKFRENLRRPSPEEDRKTIRDILNQKPTVTIEELAIAVGRTEGWVKENL